MSLGDDLTSQYRLPDLILPLVLKWLTSPLLGPIATPNRHQSIPIPLLLSLVAASFPLLADET